MQFSTRKRRRTPTVIIVSLIDVLLVVLIFLMVTTAFKETPAIRITLPETSHAPPKAGASETPPMIITITTNPPNFYLGQNAVTLDRLKSELLDRSKQNSRLVVAIRADDQAAYGNVLKVEEAAKEANVKEIRAYVKAGIKPQ